MSASRHLTHDRPRRAFRAIRAVFAASLVAVAAISLPAGAFAQSRIKDIADIEGVRDNLLVGYGLVVGLNGSGDSLNNAPFTEQSLVAMLERLGVNSRGSRLRTDNVAAVMVTANLPPFARQGSRVDVRVSAIGDAKSLLGGTLLVTPLLGADGEIYSVAQGQVAVGGFSAQGQGASITQGVPTVGRIASGAIVEREVTFAFDSLEQVTIALRNPDFTTAQRIASAVNAYMGGAISKATDPASVRVQVPAQWRGDVAGLMTQIEQLRVQPDQVAKVVIDENSGIIVMGENVRIDTVAIAQGNLTIRITETPQVSQPGPFSQGQTAVVPRTNIEVDQGADRKLAVLPKGVTLQELVDGLNMLGISPRDMISILQAIKAAGALQAEIEVM